MRHQISVAEYQPIRNRNWGSKYKIVSGTVCVGQTCKREKLWLPRWDIARDQRLSEQYHRGNIETSEIYPRTSAIQNFSRGDSNYQYIPGRNKIQTFFTGDWFWRAHFHRGIFRGGFSPGTEAGCSNRHFSHVTKSFFFKNVNLRKKTDRNFRGSFLKNRFRHVKLYSNPPSWLARSRCHMGTLWKTKDWSSYFWERQPFRFWYVKVHRQRKLKSTKTGIFS